MVQEMNKAMLITGDSTDYFKIGYSLLRRFDKATDENKHYLTAQPMEISFDRVVHQHHVHHVQTS